MSSQAIYDVILEIKEFVDRFRTDRKKDLELELRLGQSRGSDCAGGGPGDPSFRSGVSLDFFQRTLAMMESYKGWSAVKDWEISHEWFYRDVQHKGRHYSQLRASVTESSRMKWVEKTREKQSLDIDCRNRPYDLRASLKRERPAKIDFLVQPPAFLRIKRRKSFECEKLFRYDFTVVHQGRGPKESVVNSAPVYEIEIELLPNEQAMILQRNNMNIAASILEKMIDFLGRDSPFSLVVRSATPPPPLAL